MSSKGNKDQSSNIKEVTIEYLHDDCLLEIFQYLNIKERIKLELVCKTWNRVIKLSWNDMKILYVQLVYDGYICKIGSNVILLKTNYIFLKKYLEKCGTYLRQVEILTHEIKNVLFLSILCEIPQHCNNLTSLKIKSNTYEPLFIDENLKNLFSNNPNICNISLRNIKFSGDCFLELNASQIKELTFERCYFDSKGLFFTFLERLQNLNKFKITHYDFDDVTQVIHALNISSCEKISEINISILGMKNDNINNLSLFISKQKNLRKIELRNVFISEELAKKLNKSSETGVLEELSLGFYDDLYEEIILNISKLKKIQKFKLENAETGENLLKSLLSSNISLFELDLDFSENETCDLLFKYLDRFQNLQKLRVVFNELTDSDLLDLIKCVNKSIRKIEICLDTYSLSNEAIYNFGKLQDLESFIFDYDESDEAPNIDNLLKNLSECKNLKYLSIDFCEFSIRKLNSLSDLRFLELKYSGLNDEEILDIIKNNFNLKELRFISCSNVTNNLINEADAVKVDRGDIHFLKIFFQNCDEIIFDELKNEPLVHVIYK